MIRATLLLSAILALTLAGCAGLDSWFGVDDGGERIVAEGEAPNDKAEDWGGALWAPIGIGLGLLERVYTEIRKRAYKKAALATMEGIERIKEEAKANTLTYDKIIDFLKDAQGKQNIRPMVEELLKKLEA